MVTIISDAIWRHNESILTAVEVTSGLWRCRVAARRLRSRTIPWSRQNRSIILTIDYLNKLLIDWLIELLIDWLIDWLIVDRSIVINILLNKKILFLQRCYQLCSVPFSKRWYTRREAVTTGGARANLTFVFLVVNGCLLRDPILSIL